MPPPFCPKIEQAVSAKLREALDAAAAPSMERNPETGRLTPIPAPKTCTAPPRWTLKRLVIWVETKFNIHPSKETVRKALKRLNFSWKKAKALLNRASTAARERFVEQIHVWMQQALSAEPPLLVYLDEAHIHQEADLGYGWAPRGERLWVGSHTPGLSAKVSFYGLYFYNEGQVAIWDFPRANTEHTQTVLQRLREREPRRQIVLFWDGASYHRSKDVRALAQKLEITIQPLPSYSPDFMPVEALWRWLREDVTYHHCHATAKELIQRVQNFVQTINALPSVVADRLHVKKTLDQTEEKLRIP